MQFTSLRLPGFAYVYFSTLLVLVKQKVQRALNIAGSRCLVVCIALFLSFHFSSAHHFWMVAKRKPCSEESPVIDKLEKLAGRIWIFLSASS